ncbi:hypothetical protein [Deinococcus sp. 12RED42]|uniref:hypothetical protein n=1 Tax=Deinococcus sp. 12RED42 TaxID=2745872 RepID=UPI001E50A646|nr:hypothetical protein [Deinococcus sp. 12RED42]MCD0165095.1 hypothetical protein [Deinococcus sp. 12RED42]
MSHFRFPERTGWRTAGLCAALAAGPLSPAAAQTTVEPPAQLQAVPAQPGADARPVSPQDLCRAEEQLLEVTVAGASRGVLLVRLQAGPPTAALIPPEVLRPSEAGYTAGTVDCDGQPFTYLSEQVTVAFDAARQRLVLRPVLSRLTGNTLDLRGAAPRPLGATQPSWGVDYGLSLNATYSGPRQELPVPTALNGRAYLDAGGAADQLSGTLGVAAERQDSGALTYRPRATLEYTLNDQISVGAAINASPLGGSPGFGSSDFSGVGVTLRGGFDRIHPEQTLDLPLESDVVVYLNRIPVASARVNAGKLRLLNIPLTSENVTELSVDITDETGMQTLNWTYPAVDSALPPGAYLVATQIGVQQGQWTTRLQGEVGLPRRWRVAGRLDSEQGGTTQINVRAANSGPDYTVQGSVSVSVTPAATGPQARTTLGLQADRTIQGTNLSLFSVLPVGFWQDSTIGVKVSRDLTPWSFSVQGSTGFRADTWALSGTVARNFGAAGAVALNGTVTPAGWRLGLGGGYTPAPRWSLGAQVQASRNAPTDTNIGASFSAAYQIDPGNRVAATIRRDDLRADYSHVGALLAQVGVGFQAADLTVTGAVTAVNGRLTLQPALERRAVLLRTGVPNLPILVNGAFAGQTNSAGDLVLTNLTAGQTSEIRVDLNNTPFGVTVGTDRRSLLPPTAGLTIIDWRDNFRVYRWVQYRWSPTEPAGYSSVQLGTERILLDDEGYGLTPTGTDLNGELQSEDGQRRCPVQVELSSETVTCGP